MFSPCVKITVSLVLSLFFGFVNFLYSQGNPIDFHYELSIKDPANQMVQVGLNLTVRDRDTLTLKMPNWMPGYYQLMNYSAQVSNMKANSKDGKNIPVSQLNPNTWQLVTGKNSELSEL